MVGKVANNSSSNRILFELDADGIEARLRQRVARAEFLALLLLLFMQWGFVYIRANFGPLKAGVDMKAFYDAANGDYWGFYYPHWVLPIFKALSVLPGEMGYLIWGTVNIFALWAAIRIFGGKPAVALLSYQAFSMAFFGQVSGLTALGLGLLWWGMARQRWNVAGLGGLMAATKFQIGGTMGLAIWLLAPATWRERLRVLALPAVIAILSVIITPAWPGHLLDSLRHSPPNAEGSISLWQWIGPVALLLWLPPVLLKVTPGRRIIAVGATAALALPYFQQNDLVHLYMFPVGWLALVGNLGYGFVVLEWAALRAMTVIAIICYLGALKPALQTVYRQWQVARTSEPENL